MVEVQTVYEMQMYGLAITPWAYVPAFMLLWICAGQVLKKIIFGRIRKLAAKTETRVDDLVLESFSFPATLLIIFSGVAGLMRWTPLRMSPTLQTDANYVLLVATLAAGVVFADRVSRGLITLYSDRVELFRAAGSLIQIVIRMLIIAIGALMLLEALHIPITGLVASLGIGSLAFALALQSTLENFVSGVQIVADRQIQQGNFVKLDSGEEGCIEKIGWRSVWLRTGQNNMVIVPTKGLINSRVLNYSYPTPEMGFSVNVGVHYSSDLERVEKIALEVAAHIQKTVAGGVSTFTPAVRFTQFGASSIDMVISLRADKVESIGLLKHELIKAIAARFAKESICIPYPVHAINVEQERAVFPVKNDAKHPAVLSN